MAEKNGEYIGKEEIRINGAMVGVVVAKTSDGRHWLKLETVLYDIFGLDDSQATDILKTIAKPYFRKIVIDGIKVKFIDRLALGMIANKIDNYETYIWAVNRCVGSQKQYSLNLMDESATYLMSRVSNICMEENKIKSSNQAQQDLLHRLEAPASDKEALEIYRQLEDLRLARRIVKNDYKRISIARDFFNSHKVTNQSVTQLSNAIKGFDNVVKKKLYNQRCTSADKEQWKGTIDTTAGREKPKKGNMTGNRRWDKYISK